ncbi:hypothetical protein LOZ51_005645 [Ophidiomyces ophidiicola]|nr:hypothetical protein LOZ55_001438 [Ophidiomyces ophidiicola]KAI1987882.1 hypothetical protein LOZ51_005645 [Ophidiomyces ophidiicola]KAI1989846.1 hypothetical protein LOZ54_002738 [Ophidiomyces ophidiicola]
MPPKAANNRQPASQDTRNSGSPAARPSEAASDALRQSVPARATPTARGGPVQRLQTLKKRTPSGSLVPLNPDGTAPKPTLRYQPKAVARRSKEERDAREQLEAERQRERIADAVATRRATERSDRGRGRGRGRGGAFGRVTSDVGGPLGSGKSSRTNGKYRQFGGKHSRIEGFGDAERADVSSDEESDHGPKFSIDQINIHTDSESETGEPDKGKAPAAAAGPASAGARGLRPIRVERMEHVDRNLDMNTEESSSKSAELRRQAKQKSGKGDSLFVESDEEEAAAGADDVQMADEDQHVQIKDEPTDADSRIPGDIPTTTDTPADDAGPKKPQTSRKQAATKNPRSKLKTEEERREYDQHEQDVEELKQALGNIHTADVVANNEGDEESIAKVEAIKDERQGRLFLLQFPPLTPNLIVPSTEPNNPDEAMVVEGASTHTQEAITIKHENGTTSSSITLNESTNLPIPSKSASAAPLITAENNHLPPGRVGKLQIHRSGRATVDWGGITFELNKGSDVDFLQDAVVASDSKPGETGAADRRIWAMSQVSGKFVVTPDWDRLLGE